MRLNNAALAGYIAENVSNMGVYVLDDIAETMAQLVQLQSIKCRRSDASKRQYLHTVNQTSAPRPPQDRLLDDI